VRVLDFLIGLLVLLVGMIIIQVVTPEPYGSYVNTMLGLVLVVIGLYITIPALASMAKASIYNYCRYVRRYRKYSRRKKE
jgi:uncharacterized membrane protein